MSGRSYLEVAVEVINDKAHLMVEEVDASVDASFGSAPGRIECVFSATHGEKKVEETDVRSQRGFREDGLQAGWD